MADAIVAEALATPGVALLEPGSALVMDMVTQTVSAQAARRELSVKVLRSLALAAEWETSPWRRPGYADG
jgi:hypothetical protein